MSIITLSSAIERAEQAGRGHLASLSQVLRSLVRGEIASKLEIEAGSGVAGIAGAYATAVYRKGGLIKTEILIDLTGLTSADSDLDVIGEEDTTNPCHIGQITSARNGIIIAGSLKCLEAPASLTDLGIYSDPDGTLVYEDAIASAGDGETIIVTPAVQAVANGAVPLANVVPAGDYLYIVNGATDTPDDFTAGILLLELWGTVVG